MKKFLSSLLALTMILSLVIVPANASETPSSPANTEVTDGNQGGSTGGDSGSGAGSGSETPETPFQTQYQLVGTVTVSVTDGKTTVKGGENVTFTANSTSVKVQKKTAADGNWEDTVEADNVLITGKWSGDGISESESSTTSLTKSWEAGQRDARKTATYTVTATVNGSAVSGSKSGSASVTVKAAPTLTIKANDATVTDSNTVVEILKENGRLELTATSSGVSDPKYRWYEGTDSMNAKSESSTYSVSTDAKTDSAVTVTCKVYEGTVEEANLVKTATCKYQIVEEDLRWDVTSSSATLRNGSVTLTKKHETTTITAVLQKKSGSSWSPVDAATYSFDLNKSGIATLSDKKKNEGKVTVELQDEGNVTLAVSTKYKGTTQSTNIRINGELLKSSLKEVENGDKLEFDYDDLATLANKLLPTGVDVKSGGHITIKSYPTSASAGGTLYLESTQLKGASASLSTDANLTFYAQAGFIDDANLELAVTGDDNQSYTVYVTIPVTSAGKIEETVTGSSANSSVSFDVNDVVDYDKVYIRGSVSGSSSSRTFTPSSLASSNYDGYWDGNTKSGSGWVLFDDDDTVTIPASAFSKTTGKVTLYVVGIDNDDVAYTGTIEVSQKSYTIEYNVVAGDSVDFKQADFDDFVKTYAYDNDDRYSSRNDDIEISYVTFSLPSANTEGTLYEGKSKIARNDKIEDVDDVTFESVAKAKGTISIGFTAYGKIYKNGSTSKTNTKEFDYSGTVVISVVNEDIVYEVGVNSSVKFDSSHFQSFLNTSSKRATLDYVTFDVGSNKAVTSYFSGTGALYRYYSAYGVNSTVDSKDEFYYNPKSSSKNYDLDNVTYVTSRFAKTGDIVYIPFTAYGTRNEKAEGTVAIKVKQTMNFTDVHTYDYFYDAVQWAVNKDITKGTSATTFSPKTGCTRAMIVTFLWRAADSPEPRSNSNKFTDVSATKHADYMKAILWATEQGITTGTGNNKFSPDATCTRAMIVTFLYRYKNSPAVYGSLNFTDVSKTTHSAYYNAILWASNNKIATGYNNIFDPNGTCNRGDAVTFLYRALA